MSVTTNSIITASPSIVGADAELDAAVLPPRDAVHDRRDDRLAVLALGGEQAPPERARAPRACPVASRPGRSTATTATHESTNDAPTAAMPISAPLRGSRFPKKRITTNETAGSERDDPGVSRARASALQLVDLVEVGAVQVAVDEQHDRETDADLGGGDRDDEEREHLARDRRGGRAENATRLRLTALSMSSTLISTSTRCGGRARRRRRCRTGTALRRGTGSVIMVSPSARSRRRRRARRAGASTTTSNGTTYWRKMLVADGGRSTPIGHQVVRRA